MKPNASYLSPTVAILTLFVCCQSFGQAAVLVPTLPVGPVKKLEAPRTERAPDLKNSLLIDFSKIDFNRVNIDIKSEIRQGPGSGGGGNSCALMLKQNTVEILSKIKLYPLFQQDGVGEILEQTIKSAQFYIGKDLYINGKKVEAINYPVDKAIYVEQAFCDKISVLSAASIGLTLHEYLGLAGFDDTQYQISGDFVATYYQQETAGKVGKAYFNTSPMNSLRAKFQTGKPIVNEHADSLFRRFSSRCEYFSEIDGRSFNQPLGILLPSIDTVSIYLDKVKMKLPVASGTTVASAYLTPAGMIANLPSEDPMQAAFLVLREYQGSLIGEWSIAGKNHAETFRISRSSYPVFAVALRGTLVTGYSVCAPSALKPGK